MDRVKTILILICSALMTKLGVLAIPVLLMVGCNLIDYVTGLCAAKYRNEKISSAVGINGIVKKVCMWVLVLIGSWIDVLLKYSVEQINLNIGINNIVATIVCIWIVVNEMISILENMNDIGVDLPPFLMPIIKNIQTTVEKTADGKDE